MIIADHVANAISSCWDYRTAHKNEWSPANPALNQCAVTALLVYDLYGGVILTNNVKGQRHYWNRINGYEVDLTASQFPDGMPWWGKGVEKPAEDLRRSVKVRYAILRDRYNSLTNNR